LGNGEQVTAQAQNDGHASGDLNPVTVEAAPEEFRNREYAAAAQVAPKVDGAKDVARHLGGGPDDVGTSLARAGEARLAQEAIGAHNAGHQCANDQ